MLRQAFGMLGLLLLALPARASDPVGVYALIEKAEVEPSEGQPERIRLTGVFALSVADRGDAYTPPARGFLYFSLPKNKQETARKEWNDLRKMAGAGEGVAFGSRYLQHMLKLKVRTDADTTKDAVPYPLGVGVTKLGKNDPQTKALSAVKPKP